MPVALIVAAAGKNRVIGRDGDLPWHFSSDLKFFKETTLGQPVLMGRITYQSILKRLGKPLPGRRNIVLTRDRDFHDERVTVIHDVSEIAAQAKPGETLFIIGGAKVYEQTMDIADMIYLTAIEQEIEGDTVFPPVDGAKWQLTDGRNTVENGVTLRFLTYRKI